MKLIDLLVKELPKRGGWPDGANYAVQDADGIVKFAKTLTYLHYLAGEWRSNENGHDWIHRDKPFEGNFVTEWTADDNHSAVISMARYECEISKKETGKQLTDEWNCEGLPPVGCECECHVDEGIIHCVVVGYDFDEKAVVMRNVPARKYFSIQANSGRIKPLRTEAERKHEAVLESICAVLEMVAQDYKREDEAKLIYEAIAAGKIPGVKLED
ncbi:hypothetical protein [Salmonella phage PJN025]|nr:hypothetical protein [Salmonella phage PJN025]